ncbi:MAG: citramalate synthase [Actinobacteria bacterium]|nr:citramalate synthase [Actinomycetota bacterium]
MPASKAKSSKRIAVYDTTLRDGAQALGVSLSLQDKLSLAAHLDDIGVDYIEGGYPLSNPKDRAFFREVRKLKLRHARIAAFGMTRKPNTRPSEDVYLAALKSCPVSVMTLVGKSWDLHVQKVLRTTLEENLDMIGDSVKFFQRSRREVIFDAEHFFDGYKHNPEYALASVLRAAETGADLICLCDTNGGTLPDDIAAILKQVSKEVKVPLGIHVHNDSGVAVAGTLAAVAAGATHVQLTVNGLGERCGNADLTTVVPNLILKMKKQCLRPNSLRKLTELSRYVAEITLQPLSGNQPFVGPAAFAHKGGMHVHAMKRDTRTYEHVRPEDVGNSRRIILSELSGAATILAKSEKLAVIKDRKLLRKVLEQVQDLENEGYQFEVADGSFEILLRKALGRWHQFFELDHYRTAILRRGGDEPLTEAIVKILIDGHVEHRVAEGDGPVNALDEALRRGLRPHYPAVSEMRLVDYKVRVINPKQGTAAKVCVIIQSSDKEHQWGTVGVSENVIEASWLALVDSVEYKLLLEEDKEKAKKCRGKKAQSP